MLCAALALMIAVPALPMSDAQPSDSPRPAAVQADPETAPVRVGGDLEAGVEQVGDLYRSGRQRTEAPLPEGYPAPTPVGSIELKHYPSVRRAEISGESRSRDDLNRASYNGFFPLFQHIERNDIAMTAPVEVDYHGMDPTTDRGDAPEAWTMSFLYRTADLHPTGNDEQDSRIRIIDTEPVTVLSIGVVHRAGGYVALQQHLDALVAWLEANSEWEVAGDLRTLGYNGPSVPAPRRWWEVQIPVRRSESSSAERDETVDGSN